MAVVAQVELFLVLATVGLVLGPADAGGLRAVQLLVSQPATVVLGAMLVLATPTVATAAQGPGGTSLRTVHRQVVRQVAPVVVGVAVVAALAGPLMQLLFPRWSGYAPLALPVALQTGLLAWCMPAMALLNGTRRGRVSLALHLCRSTVVVAGTALGGVLGGAAGPRGRWPPSPSSSCSGPPRSSAGSCAGHRAVTDDRPEALPRRPVQGPCPPAARPTAPCGARPHRRLGAPTLDHRRRQDRPRWAPVARLLFHRPLHQTVVTVPGSGGIRLHVVGARLERTLYWFGEQGYEPGEAAWWRLLCSRATAVLEIGSNIGWYTTVGAAAAPVGAISRSRPTPRPPAPPVATSSSTGSATVWC